MNRKLFYVVLLSICFLISGCSNNSNSSSTLEEHKDNENKNVKEVLSRVRNTSYDWNCEVPLNEIKDIGSANSMFITNDGLLYEFNLMQKYSTTNNNCRKIDTDYRFKRFINGAIISTDNKIYAYYNNEFVERMSGWTEAFNYDLFDYNENVMILNGEFDINHRYGIVKNNKVYTYDKGYITQVDIKNEEEIFSIPSDETVIGLYESYIKTDKAYYKYDIVNRNECNTYADIECEYGIVKDEVLTKVYDDIYFINNNYIIVKDDYKKIYTDVYGG